MKKNQFGNNTWEIALTSLKLGCIGFGGIAGMIATMEDEIVNKKKWVDHTHFLDIVSTSNIVPGPNSVEIIMHCGKERGGKTGLVVAGLGYIFPATVICLLFAWLYSMYGELPRVQQFLYGIRPATTALIIITVFRLAGKTLKQNIPSTVLCVLVFGGALLGINEVLLILAAGLLYSFYHMKKDRLMEAGTLFWVFLKIGAILYGSGFVLYAYMNNALVENHHWLTKQQLTDAIAVGQITPGPILSSATFAGYLVSGTPGALLATAGIFLPSFFISFFMHRLLSAARNNKRLRVFLDGLNAASIAVVAAVGFDLVRTSLSGWQEGLILAVCLGYVFTVKKLNTVLVIVLGSLSGFLLSLL